jgi:TonB-dependent starch-binding outer membrane protein SusC
MKKQLKLKTTKIILLLGLWMISFWQLMAQDVQIQGKVTDGLTNETLPGVNIIIEGTTKGVMTGADGTYQISAPKGSTLIFSYISYLSEKIQVSDLATINVALKPSVEKLQEVVVIGYGTVKKADATGSVATVSSNEFNKGAISSPQDLIVGKTAGVVVTPNSGAPGSGATIRIRGGSSVNASNDPLIVIDGVPIDNGGLSGSQNGLLSVNPNDIETFTVLKDASATAIYGSRASNGVILITTKKGSKQLKISYNAVASIGTVTKKLDVLSADEYRDLVNKMYPGITGADSTIKTHLGSANTDWQNEIFRTAFGQDHNLTLSGTTLKTPYRISLGYTSQNGILKTTEFDRTTASIDLQPSLLADHLKLSINNKFSYVNNNFSDAGAIGSAITFNPTQPVMDDNTRFGGYTTITDVDGNPVTGAGRNPVAQINLTHNKATAKRSLGNFQADYKFHFLPDLRANLNLAYDYQEGRGHNNVDSIAPWTYDSKNGSGTRNTYWETRKMQLADFYLNYVKSLDGISSKIDLMVGHSYQHFWDSKFSITKNQAETYTSSEGIDNKTEYFLESYFGRLNYALFDRYLLTFTLRDDGTTRFASTNRWGVFPSIALAWKINSEPFLANSKVVSDLKLRLGYGVTGQQNLGLTTGANSVTNDYFYLPVYGISTSTAQYQFGNTFYNTLRPAGYNTDLKWEQTSTTNIALDYGFLRDRITGSIEYYYRKTSDLINAIPVPAGTNLTNIITTNIGDLENRGLEFAINAKIISTKDLYWEIGYNISYNKNKITKLNITNDPTYGVPSGLISGGVGTYIQSNGINYPYQSFYVYQQVYGQNGKPIEGLYVDRNGDGIVNSNDLYHYKKAAPDQLMGVSSRVTWKNWDVSFNGRISLGNYAYNNVESNQGNYQYVWNTGLNYLSNVPKEASDANFHSAQYLSDYYVQNASFFRMDNISLSYKFDKFLLKKIDLRISLTCQNVFVVTKYKGLDPEVDAGGTTNPGIDNNFYPRPRTYLLGLSINF